MSLEKAKAYLKARNLEERIIEPEASTATVPLAAEALGVGEGNIAKTLSFLGKEAPILILAEGTARIDNRKYKDTFQVKAKMIPYEEVESYIGHAPGGVCPFGVNPEARIYCDVSLKKYDYVYPAAGNDHSGVKLTPDELYDCSEALEWIDVCKEV